MSNIYPEVEYGQVTASKKSSLQYEIAILSPEPGLKLLKNVKSRISFLYVLYKVVDIDIKRYVLKLGTFLTQLI